MKNKYSKHILIAILSILVGLVLLINSIWRIFLIMNNSADIASNFPLYQVVSDSFFGMFSLVAGIYLYLNNYKAFYYYLSLAFALFSYVVLFILKFGFDKFDKYLMLPTLLSSLLLFIYVFLHNKILPNKTIFKVVVFSLIGVLGSVFSVLFLTNIGK